MSFRTVHLVLLPLLLVILTKASGQPIPGSFIVQIEGQCGNICLASLQEALDSSPDTDGCTASRGSIIGRLSFVDVNCPTSASVQESSVASVLFSQVSAATAMIQLVKQDFVVTTAATTTSLWGVDEADGGVTKAGGNPVRDGLRTCSMTSNNGDGVNVWILDTGCDPTNDGLCQGFYGGSNVCQDNHGHGQHVGGTVSDPTYGVAPAATRSCVKVLSDSGSGSYSTVISGIELAANNRGMLPNGDVINLSLGGPKYDPVNNAVSEARSLGVFFAIAAGNSNDNACNYSPASTPGGGIFTVQAHDINLNAASFTNYATSDLKCTDLSAPGVSIASLPGGRTLSGTSMASPHVAGACAILLSDGLKPTRKRLTANSVRIKRSGILGRRTLGLACAT